MAQLAINRLQVPCELHTLIKEYALLTKERKNIMNIQIQIFNKIIILPNLRPPLGTIMLVNNSWIIADDLIIYNRKYISLCKRCGNYRSR